MEKRILITICLALICLKQPFVFAAKDDPNIYRREGLKNFLPSSLIPENLFNDPNEIGSDSLITLKAIDHEDRPVPYCRIVFVDRDEKTTRFFYETATNEKGFAYCNIPGDTFSINAHLYEYNPTTKASYSQHKKIGELYNVHDNKIITVQFDPFPTGSCTAEGQVLDQYGKPLTKYELRLNYLEGIRTDWSESYSTYQSIEVNDPQGRFEFGGLLPRTYSYMIYPEDAIGYEWDFDMGTVTIPEEPNAVVRQDIEIEAKELLYGQAFYNDSVPVYPGAYQLWFKKYTPEEQLKYHTLGEGGRVDIEPNGSFRIFLSRQEKNDLMEASDGYVIIEDGEGLEIGQVHIDKLSEIPEEAPKLFFPRKSPRSSLVNSLLPDMNSIKTDYYPDQAKSKRILVCFFDMEQRPSRNCILQLAKQADELEQKGITIVAIQASTTEQDTLDEWVKENNITFPIEMIETDPSTSLGTGEEEFRFNWGVKSLPWLILTDVEHVVTAEGFNLDELNNELKRN